MVHLQYSSQQKLVSPARTDRLALGGVCGQRQLISQLSNTVHLS